MCLGLQRIFAHIAGQVEWESSTCILTHLPSLTEWFSMNVVTDGFVAFDKICRCVANCRPQLRLLSQVGHSEQLSPVGTLLVSCRYHPLSSTWSRCHQSHSPPSSCLLSSVTQLEQLGVPRHGRVPDGTRGAYLCRALLRRLAFLGIY